MRFDGEGRVVWTPREFFDLVSVDPRRTIDNLLLRLGPNESYLILQMRGHDLVV